MKKLQAWLMWKTLSYPSNQWWKIRYKLLKQDKITVL
jgi:hypothetical protein